jgi:hypothetical protein
MAGIIIEKKKTYQEDARANEDFKIEVINCDRTLGWNEYIADLHRSPTASSTRHRLFGPTQAG